MNVKFLAWCLGDGIGSKICYPAPPSSMHRDETICPQTCITLKCLITSKLHKSSQRIEREGNFPNSFYEGSQITRKVFIPKLHKAIIRKENFRSISLMNMNENSKNKILGNKIKKYIKRKFLMTKWGVCKNFEGEKSMKQKTCFFF